MSQNKPSVYIPFLTAAMVRRYCAEGKLICVQTSNYTSSALVDDDVGLFLSQSHMKLPTNYQNYLKEGEISLNSIALRDLLQMNLFTIIYFFSSQINSPCK